MQYMDLFELYRSACADFNTQQSGHMRPQQNYQLWIENISKEYFRELFKDWEKNQILDDDYGLAFLKSVNIPVTIQPGKNFDFIKLPLDYAYYSSLRVFIHADQKSGCLCEEYDILDSDGACGKYEDPDFKEIREKNKGQSVGEGRAVKVDNQRWGSAINHRRKKPILEQPVITQINGGFKISPKGIGIVVLDYIRYPVSPVFAYTTNTDGTVNYDLANSTQLDWPVQVKNIFLARLKMKYASATSQGDKYQHGMVEKKETK